jgi:hypothetical protein
LRTICAVRGETHPTHDCQEPRTRIFFAERREVSDGAENRFLNGVFGIGSVPGQIHRESEAGRQVWQYNALEPTNHRVTTTFPCITGCSEQKYGYSPLSAKPNV